jgi:chromosomal replication initiation ATPase DnaA
MNYEYEYIKLKAAHTRLKTTYENKLESAKREIQELRQMILKPEQKTKKVDKNFDELLRIVCQESNVIPKDFFSRSRKREYVIARAMFCYFAYRELNQSLKKIGLFLNRDHSTVIHGRDMIGDYLDINMKFETAMHNRIKSRLNAIPDNYLTEVTRISPHLS